MFKTIIKAIGSLIVLFASFSYAKTVALHPKILNPEKYPDWLPIETLKFGSRQLTIDDIINAYNNYNLTGSYEFPFAQATPGKALPYEEHEPLYFFNSRKEIYVAYLDDYVFRIESLDSINQFSEISSEMNEARLKGEWPFDRQPYSVTTPRTLDNVVDSAADYANKIKAGKFMISPKEIVRESKLVSKNCKWDLGEVRVSDLKLPNILCLTQSESKMSSKDVSFTLTKKGWVTAITITPLYYLNQTPYRRKAQILSAHRTFNMIFAGDSETLSDWDNQLSHEDLLILIKNGFELKIWNEKNQDYAFTSVWPKDDSNGKATRFLEFIKD